MSFDLSETLLFQIKARGLPLPVREHRFHHLRKWRFDLAWPELMIAAEAEGGTFIGGRHTRGRGFQNDCEKYNTAQLKGWQIYRFVTEDIKSGEAVAFLEMVFKRNR